MEQNWSIPRKIGSTVHERADYGNFEIQKHKNMAV